MSDIFPQTLLDNDFILFALLIDTITGNRILVYCYRVSVLWKHESIVFKILFRASYWWSACWCPWDGSLVCRNVNVLVSSVSGPGLDSAIILCQWIDFFPPNPTYSWALSGLWLFWKALSSIPHLACGRPGLHSHLDISTHTTVKTTKTLGRPQTQA